MNAENIESTEETAVDSGSENSETESSTPVECKHVYVEVGADLLAKQKALCDIIEYEGMPSTLVFCNLPSDTDLVEVMLKKRGISAKKLIGRVPQHKVARAVAGAMEGSITALVLTDIAAQNLEISDFELVINYSVHDDPEVYFHRASPHESTSKLRKAVSLISPVDITNFHYLRKMIDIEKTELPDEEKLMAGRFEALCSYVKSLSEAESEEVEQFTAKVLENENRDLIVKQLAKHALAPGGGIMGFLHRLQRVKDSDSDFDDRDDRSDNRRGGRSDRRSERRSERRSDRHADHEEQRDRKPKLPPKRDVRFYLGMGSKNSFSEDAFADLLEKHTSLTRDKMKRFSLRECYAFVDFDEEDAGQVLEGLDEVDYSDGSKFFLKKAVVISVPREEAEQSDDSSEENQDDDSAQETQPTESGAESAAQ